MLDSNQVGEGLIVLAKNFEYRRTRKPGELASKMSLTSSLPGRNDGRKEPFFRPARAQLEVLGELLWIKMGVAGVDWSRSFAWMAK
jgi:hypothetical protein